MNADMELAKRVMSSAQKRAAQIREAASIKQITPEAETDDGMALTILIAHLIAEHNARRKLGPDNLVQGCDVMGEFMMAEAMAHRARIDAGLAAIEDKN